jgi:hypothetical protein
MNWGERVLRADPHLTVTARQLVDVISRFFATHAYAYCSFHDVEAGGLIGVSSAQIRAARIELEERNFLRPLHRPNGKQPRYRLCFGYARAEDTAQATIEATQCRW